MAVADVPTVGQNVWRNRIVRYEDVDPEQLLANPKNWRIHPRHQQEALAGVIRDVGFVDPVKVQDGSDLVIDGHLRVSLALRDGVATIPVAYTDLSDDEADLILATFDPLSAMAATDSNAVTALLDGIRSGDDAVTRLLADLRAGVVLPPSVATPVEFTAYDDSLETEFCCPKCGYEWSGKPK